MLRLLSGLVTWLAIGASLGASSEQALPSIGIFVLTQRNAWHESRADRLVQAIRKQNQPPKAQLSIETSTSGAFSASHGDWSVWVALSRLRQILGDRTQWLLVLDESTELSLENLLTYVSELSSEEESYHGHGLFDRDSTVIHHYAFINDPQHFRYADFAGGVLLSKALLHRLVDAMAEGKQSHDFTIDPKHELAMMIWADGKGTRLTEANDLFCTLPQQIESSKCITKYHPPVESGECGSSPVPGDQLFFAVKTFHGHHKDRVVVLKRTWAHDAEQIEYYSDEVDAYIPTIDLGVKNTEHGHCEKTMEILRRFKASDKFAHATWLIVADDDTLISVPRLRRLLACYESSESLIVGERYAYGFSVDGEGGYAYPTGGPAMVFSRPAADLLAKECSCPRIDSPDDMIIGMCARSLAIPIIHSEAFHQARPEDYADDYLARIQPISFHKHTNTDPYKIFMERLKVEESESSSGKTEL